jgi:hypothetical protein
MKNKFIATALLTLGCLSTFYAVAAENKPDPITAQEKSEVIASLGKQLNKKYVFPEIAEKVALQLAQKDAAGGYGKANTKTDFAEQLTKDLREQGNDLHFRVNVMPDFQENDDPNSIPTQEEVDKIRKFELANAYGIVRIERLPGNVGYLELAGFGLDEFVTHALASALSVLSGTDAMIIDLRRNGGGSPETVADFMGHFFIEGDERHLNDLYSRPKNTTREYWTNPGAVGRYTNPVYVLTSGRTFSAAEECAYDFQTQKRAVLIGEKTGGGANPGSMFALGHDLVAFIPTGKAINPVTHTNWEHVGVKPDIEVPAAQAFYSAYAAALKSLLPKAADPRLKKRIEDALAYAEKSEPEPANYAKP